MTRLTMNVMPSIGWTMAKVTESQHTVPGLGIEGKNKILLRDGHAQLAVVDIPTLMARAGGVIPLDIKESMMKNIKEVAESLKRIQDSSETTTILFYKTPCESRTPKTFDCKPILDNSTPSCSSSDNPVGVCIPIMCPFYRNATP